MAEIHKEFLASWDGRALPEAWLEHWLKHGDHLEDRSREEYRGGVGVCVPSWPRGSGVCKPDRFGPDNREMCAATCARQRCTGCCFCVGVPLPVYLEIHTGEPLPRNQTAKYLDRPLDAIGWVTVEHVQQMVTQELPHPGCLTRTQASLSTRAVPAYLLHRTYTHLHRTVQDDNPLDFGYNFGRVICLPGAVRSHVAADQLAEYAERLACSGTLVEILSGDSCECTLGPDVLTRRDAHITRHAQVVKQAHEVARQEWLLARQEESDWIALNQPGRRDLDEQVCSSRRVAAAGSGTPAWMVPVRSRTNSFARATLCTTRLARVSPVRTSLHGTPRSLDPTPAAQHSLLSPWSSRCTERRCTSKK